MEISRSPSVEKERCSWQESSQKGPTSQCRPCPHKTLQVCGVSHYSPRYVCACASSRAHLQTSYDALAFIQLRV